MPEYRVKFTKWGKSFFDTYMTVTLRHWIIGLVDECEAAWNADCAAEVENMPYDWEHCPIWLNTHITEKELGA